VVTGGKSEKRKKAKRIKENRKKKQETRIKGIQLF